MNVQRFLTNCYNEFMKGTCVPQTIDIEAQSDIYDAFLETVQTITRLEGAREKYDTDKRPFIKSARMTRLNQPGWKVRLIGTITKDFEMEQP